MRESVKHRLLALLDGFWFVPALIAAGHVVLALILVEIDRRSGRGGVGVGFSGTASAARGILETIAASLITVAGLAFSITIVVLTLVSSQFTPRTVPGFLSDRLNQLTAGWFVGVFAFCLAVLRSVRSESEAFTEFVPSLSVTVAMLFALVGLALLFLFIHHVATSIQASSIAARIGRGTLDAVGRLYPPTDGLEADVDPKTALAERRLSGQGALVYPSGPGYVRSVAIGRVVERLPEGGAVVVHATPGDFVTSEDPLLEVWPASLAAEAGGDLRRLVAVSEERTLRQDALYGVRQLSEVGMRALSPGINDPSTASTCVGYLRAVLERLARTPMPARVQTATGGRLVIARRQGFDDFVEGAFLEMGRFSGDNARIVIEMVDALGRVAEIVQAEGRRERLSVLVRTARAVAGPALEDARTDNDREAMEAALAWATDAGSSL